MLHSRNDRPIMPKRMRQDVFSSDDDEEAPLMFKKPIVALAKSSNPVSSHVMAQSKQDVNVQLKFAKGGSSSGANNHMFDDKKRIENCEIKDSVNRNNSQDNKIHPSMNVVTSGNTRESDLSKRASRLMKSGEIFSSHGNSENGSMSRSITNVQSDKYSMATGTTGLAKKGGDRLLPGKNPHLKSAVEVKPEDSDDDDKPLFMRFQTAKPVQSKTVAKVEGDSDDVDPHLFMRFQTAKPVESKTVAKVEGDSYDDDPQCFMRLPTAKPVESKTVAKVAVDSDDDKPLSLRFAKSGPAKTLNKDLSSEDDDSDDDKPLLQRLNKNGLVNKNLNEKGTSVTSEFIPKKRPPQDSKLSSTSATKKLKTSSLVRQETSDDSDDEDNVPIAQRMKKSSITSTPSTKLYSSAKLSTPANKAGSSTKKIDKNSKLKPQIRKVELTSSKNVKIERVPPGSGEGQKWTNLEHNGVIFPPTYKPHGVKMLYNGKSVDLTPDQEEVATMFAVMKDTDYATKSKFLENFWHDWKQILGPKHVIQKFELCDFTPIYEWHLREKEKKKQMTAEEKKALKEEKLKQEDRYKWAYVDGKKEQVGNFRVEPPALFRGRGEHPKMGKLKKRIFPEDITINIGKGAPIPECPMPGHRWKEIRHDNTVTWLAFWNDPINTKEFKYVFLAASSSLKGQSDKEKYEKARALKEKIDDIRSTYTRNFQSKDETRKQIAVATYLIDRLALRAGNEKDDDEADTVGCCTLKVENVALVESKSIQFDFLGKDSIRYFNTVEVDPRVYKAIGDFKKGKKPGDDLFDRIDTSKLNAHLKEIMPGLTAKVFRTYNASITLDRQLVCAKGNDVIEKLAAYQKANKEVAILCNHQRSVAKTHGTQMERLKGKIEEIEAQIKELETDLLRARRGKPPLKDAEGKQKKSLSPEKLELKIAQAKSKREKLKKDIELKDELKTVALGTSKINYMDPRITVAWCKRNEVPIEKVFNKSLLAKFAWAMDIEPDYEF